jgi:hypothetical protein
VLRDSAPQAIFVIVGNLIMREFARLRMKCVRLERRQTGLARLRIADLLRLYVRCSHCYAQHSAAGDFSDCWQPVSA